MNDARRTSLQRAIDRAVPILVDRAKRYENAGIDEVRLQLQAARATDSPTAALRLTKGLTRWMVDSYPDLSDAELSEALDWVERAAAAWYDS